MVAPFDSEILFAQRFREYGQLLVVSTADDYQFVLTGMTKIYGVECQKLLEGEPVGVMPGSSSKGAPSEDGRELYFEIREKGKAIDPQLWLLKSGQKSPR